MALYLCLLAINPWTLLTGRHSEYKNIPPAQLLTTMVMLLKFCWCFFPHLVVKVRNEKQMAFDVSSQDTALSLLTCLSPHNCSANPTWEWTHCTIVLKTLNQLAVNFSPKNKGDKCPGQCQDIHHINSYSELEHSQFLKLTLFVIFFISSDRF